MNETLTGRVCSRKKCYNPAGRGKLCPECRVSWGTARRRRREEQLDEEEDRQLEAEWAAEEARRKAEEVEQYKRDAATIPTAAPDFAEWCRRYVMACLYEV